MLFPPGPKEHPLFVINFNIARHYKGSSVNFKVCCEANKLGRRASRGVAVGGGCSRGFKHSQTHGV